MTPGGLPDQQSYLSPAFQVFEEFRGPEIPSTVLGRTPRHRRLSLHQNAQKDPFCRLTDTVAVKVLCHMPLKSPPWTLQLGPTTGVVPNSRSAWQSLQGVGPPISLLLTSTSSRPAGFALAQDGPHSPTHSPTVGTARGLG